MLENIVANIEAVGRKVYPCEPEEGELLFDLPYNLESLSGDMPAVVPITQ